MRNMLFLQGVESCEDCSCCFLVVGILASLSFNGVLGEEDQNFPPTNASDDFSYGYTNVLIEYADGKTNELLQDILQTIQRKMD